jgi:PhnB protein
MQSRANAYLNFKTNAREAMEFYKSVFGGQLTLSTFKEGGMTQDAASADLIMHSMLEAENGITFMGSDTPPQMPFSDGARVSMALSGDNTAELTGYFEKLGQGGTIKMPLAAAPWGDSFGMLTDRFGIDWLVNIAGKKS